MPNLFLFSIGGTGARVLRSLGILLATGIKVNADKIIPIIIDTDSQNKDTNRTINLLNNYREIKKSLPNIKDSFFHNEICSLNQLTENFGENTNNDNFMLNISETQGKNFEDFIDFSYIPNFETRSFLKLLYSKNNFSDSLNYGFLGSPNVGCVVLDSINENQEFKDFGNLFKPDDRIFIISSIFGGTGAAGFPLILKNLMKNNPNLANSNALINSKKGAVTVLPYFTLNKNENSRIDSSSFYTKTISALSYYENNIKGIDVLYYIGDASKSESYENVEGGEGQKNKANFIEIASALAIVDFMNMSDNDLTNKTIYKEFAILNDFEKLKFSDLGKNINNVLAERITLFKLLELYKDELKGQVGSTFMVNNRIDDSFFESSFYSLLENFIKEHWKNWLKELSLNKRGFTPFNEDLQGDYSNLINGKQIEKKFLGQSKISTSAFIKECFSIMSKQNIKEEKYIDIVNKASKELFNKYISKLIN